jgi:single-strand DNA-binding protein
MESQPGNFELEGKVKLIEDLRTFDSGFTKREFVITTDERFPQDIKFEVIKDKCALLDDLNTGDTTKVSFNVRGNEFKERYYVNLQAWKIEKKEGASGDASEEPPAFVEEGNLDDMEDAPF